MGGCVSTSLECVGLKRKARKRKKGFRRRFSSRLWDRSLDKADKSSVADCSSFTNPTFQGLFWVFGYHLLSWIVGFALMVFSSVLLLFFFVELFLYFIVVISPLPILMVHNVNVKHLASKRMLFFWD